MIGEYPGDRCGAWTSFPSGIVSGSPSRSATSGGLNTWSRTDLGGTRLTYTLDAGESVVWAALEDWNYGEPPDAELARGYWIIQTDGGGTLEVADAYDLGYNFPPIPAVTFTNRTSPGSADGLLYFEMDPTFLDASHLYNDGQPLIQVTCTAGTAAVTFVGAQIEQTAGFFVEDGWVWSGTQGADIRYPASSDDTFDEDGLGNWVVDGSPVLGFTGTSVNGRKQGAGSSEASLGDAITQRNADYAPTGGGSAIEQTVIMSYSDGVGLPGTDPSWSASIDETPGRFTCPTLATLPPNPWSWEGPLPAEWLATGEFEWLDSDTGFLGYRVGPADGVSSGLEYEGDAGTLTLRYQAFDTSQDPAAVDLYAGTTLTTLVKTTNDNLYTGELDPSGGGDVTGMVPLTEITTSDNLLVLSVDSTIRTSSTLIHSISGGMFDPDEYTASHVTLFNLSVLYGFRVPTFRYKIPNFVLVPGPGGVVSWVRNVQRNDGLGVSPWRWGSNVKVNVRVVGITFSGFGSNQSIRWRGTR